jgi:hypothetical protein
MEARQKNSQSQIMRSVDSLSILNKPETEDSWQQLSDALCSINPSTLGDTETLNVIRRFRAPILSAISSERTKLARSAMELCARLSVFLKTVIPKSLTKT